MSVAVASPRECGASAALRWTADEASANRFEETVAVEVEAMGEDRRALDERASVRCILSEVLRWLEIERVANPKKPERTPRARVKPRPAAISVTKSGLENGQRFAYVC